MPDRIERITPDMDIKVMSWERDRTMFVDIDAAGGFRFYFESIVDLFPNALRTAITSNGVIVCADERVEFGHQGEICSEGSLMLMPQHIREEFIRLSGAKAITWHRNCAAVERVFASKHGRNPVDAWEWDMYAERETGRIADELGLEFLGCIEPGHACWNGDPTRHFCRTIYWIVPPSGCQWGWSPRALPGMPPGFTIMAGYISDREYALDKLKMFVGVIMSEDRGYGSLVDDGNPVHVLVIGGSEEVGEDECDDLRSAMHELPVEVDFAVVPEQFYDCDEAED